MGNILPVEELIKDNEEAVEVDKVVEVVTNNQINTNPSNIFERCNINPNFKNIMYFVRIAHVSGTSYKNVEDSCTMAFIELDKVCGNNYAFEVDIKHECIPGNESLANIYFTTITALIYSLNPVNNTNKNIYERCTTHYVNAQTTQYLQMVHIVATTSYDDVTSTITDAFTKLENKFPDDNMFIFDLTIKTGKLHRKFITTLTGNAYKIEIP